MSEGGTLPPIFAVVLAAGKGTRMKSNRAKVLHTLCGVPMVNYVIEAIKPLSPERLLVVVGHQAELVEAVLPGDRLEGDPDAPALQLVRVPEQPAVVDGEHVVGVPQHLRPVALDDRFDLDRDVRGQRGHADG
jgi:bifunctional UDP-N-acetylglucosamine pyrophosphorylase/glucosamine-1-phosphate N-acetyltransferase